MMIPEYLNYSILVVVIHFVFLLMDQDEKNLENKKWECRIFLILIYRKLFLSLS